MTVYNQALNQATGSVQTAARYDTDVADWMSNVGNYVQNSAGVWVPLALDANGYLKASVKDALPAGTNLLGKTVPVDADGDEKFTSTNPATVQLSGSNVVQRSIIYDLNMSYTILLGYMDMWGNRPAANKSLCDLVDLRPYKTDNLAIYIASTVEGGSTGSTLNFAIHYFLEAETNAAGTVMYSTVSNYLSVAAGSKNIFRVVAYPEIGFPFAKMTIQMTRPTNNTGNSYRVIVMDGGTL